MRLAVVRYAVAVLVIAKTDRGIKLRTFLLRHRPYFLLNIFGHGNYEGRNQRHSQFIPAAR